MKLTYQPSRIKRKRTTVRAPWPNGEGARCCPVAGPRGARCWFRDSRQAMTVGRWWGMACRDVGGCSRNGTSSARCARPGVPPEPLPLRRANEGEPRDWPGVCRRWMSGRSGGIAESADPGHLRTEASASFPPWTWWWWSAPRRAGPGQGRKARRQPRTATPARELTMPSAAWSREWPGSSLAVRSSRPCSASIRDGCPRGCPPRAASTHLSSLPGGPARPRASSGR
jgi:hypothetical protein